MAVQVEPLPIRGRGSLQARQVEDEQFRVNASLDTPPGLVGVQEGIAGRDGVAIDHGRVLDHVHVAKPAGASRCVACSVPVAAFLLSGEASVINWLVVTIDGGQADRY